MVIFSCSGLVNLKFSKNLKVDSRRTNDFLKNYIKIIFISSMPERIKATQTKFASVKTKRRPSQQFWYNINFSQNPFTYYCMYMCLMIIKVLSRIFCYDLQQIFILETGQCCGAWIGRRTCLCVESTSPAAWWSTTDTTCRTRRKTARNTWRTRSSRPPPTSGPS